MPYRFLEDVAVADVAFEATGKTLHEMFESAALAVTNTMVKDLDSIEGTTKKKISVKAKNLERLLFDFLQEIVFYKDSEKLLFNKFSFEINKNELSCTAEGEELDMNKHELLVDVKAITMHNFQVEKTEDGWRAQVILDI